MSASLSQGVDADIGNALTRNRTTYTDLTDVYERTGEFRREQAKRWLIRPLALHRPPAPGTRLLELGSADGYLTGLLTEVGYSVTAVEYSPRMCVATRSHAPHAEVIEAEFLAHEFNDTYDVILCSAFVHLFPPPHDLRVLSKVRELLAHNGVAYLATTLHPQYSTGFEVKGDGGSRYRTRYTRDALTDLVAAAGFGVLSQYVTTDRLDAEKSWGNWMLAKGSRP